jgi:CHASE3 domain sensor protein
MKHIRLLDDFSNYKKDFQQLQQERQNDQERVEKLTLANQELNAIIDGLKLELQDRTTRMETLEYSLSSQTQKALLLESKIEDASSEDNHR